MNLRSSIDQMHSLHVIERPLGGPLINYNFSPTRLGETMRVCEMCGKEYKPASRSQKYCRECRIKREHKNESEN